MLFIASRQTLVDFRVQIYLFFRLWGIFVRKVGFGSFFRGEGGSIFEFFEIMSYCKPVRGFRAAMGRGRLLAGWGVVGGVGYFLLNIFLEVGWVGFILYLCMLKESVLLHYIMRCINYIGSFTWFFPLFLAAMLPLVTCCQ